MACFDLYRRPGFILRGRRVKLSSLAPASLPPPSKRPCACGGGGGRGGGGRCAAHFLRFWGVRSPFFSFLLCPPSLPFFSHYSFLYSPRTKPNHCRGGVMRAGLFSTTHFYKPCCLSWLLSRFRCSSSEFFFFFFFGRLPVQFFPYLYRSVQAVTTLVQPTKPSTQPPPPINKQGICCF